MTETIHKDAAKLEPPANLADYDLLRASFDWDDARAALAGLPQGGLNIGYEALDAHVAAGDGDRLALRWLDNAGERHDFSYARLAAQTNRFANVLTEIGVDRGERVFALADRVPELYVAALGTLKHGSVFCPLFSVFGPEPIHARMSIGDARVLVTTARLYRRKVADLRARLPGLTHVLLIADGSDPLQDAGCADLAALLDAASDDYEVVATQPEDMALLHFTSGTTGKPKGAIHVHDAVTMHKMTARYALDLSPGDVFWCTADPGWVTGTSYGIIAPLTVGATLLVDQQDFDAQRWYRTLQDERVDVWYTAPTAVRMLMKQGDELPHQYDLQRLRFIASVGEPLHAEGVLWGQRVFGQPIHDNYWQTETGGIVMANFRAMDVKPGSMGRPLPGIDAGIVERRPDGTVALIDAPGKDGELALRVGWPSMFRGYLNEEERYRRCFVDDWYLTGDLARRDDDGYFWFVGRADDVIKSAGHLIGPFEVEAALLEHPAVAEAGVIGKPDPVAGEIVKAFVALKPGYVGDAALNRTLMAHARKRLGPAVAPREIAIVESLPKTKSGKIMRRLLKARELGLPEGDTSTLEGAS